MAYVKTIWENLPSENTPINASNLNKMEEGIYQNSMDIENKLVDNYSTDTNKGYNCNYINNVVNDLQYCVATITSAQTISSNYKVNLNSIDRSSGNFTLSNGGIVIGEGINTIRVSGSVFVDSWAGGSNYLWGQIKKNNTMISTSISGSASSYLSATMSSTIISVEQGDFITLIADAGAGGSLRSGSANTFLCVEKIN